MSDVSHFDDVQASDLTADQIRGIIQQLDLDLYNLARDGKDAGATYRVGDRTVSKVEWVRELRKTRRYYADLLARIPAAEVTLYDDPHV